MTNVSRDISNFETDEEKQKKIKILTKVGEMLQN